MVTDIFKDNINYKIIYKERENEKWIKKKNKFII